jgi:c(7)-type cytochrome triheme protein
MKILKGISAIIAILIFASGAMAADKAASSGHGGDVIYTKPVKSVLFSHKTHVEDKGMACTLCHPAIFEMKSLKAQEATDYNMKGLAAGKYCGACHNGTMAFSSQARCASCHTGVKGVSGKKGADSKKGGH